MKITSFMEIDVRGVLTVISSLGLILLGLSPLVIYPPTDTFEKIANGAAIALTGLPALAFFLQTARIQVAKDNISPVLQERIYYEPKV